MPKRSSRAPETEHRPSGFVFGVVRRATAQHQPDSDAAEQPEKNPAAVALGRLGGKKGGPARAAKLTKKRRAEIARKAAAARWKKQHGARGSP